MHRYMAKYWMSAGSVLDRVGHLVMEACPDMTKWTSALSGKWIRYRPSCRVHHTIHSVPAMMLPALVQYCMFWCLKYSLELLDTITPIWAIHLWHPHRVGEGSGSGGRMRTGEGVIPCGRAHRKLGPIDIILSSSQAKKFTLIWIRISPLDRIKSGHFLSILISNINY